jgi:hypothetical protein
MLVVGLAVIRCWRGLWNDAQHDRPRRVWWPGSIAVSVPRPRVGEFGCFRITMYVLTEAWGGCVGKLLDLNRQTQACKSRTDSVKGCRIDIDSSPTGSRAASDDLAWTS